jgi:hypothetical protein
VASLVTPESVCRCLCGGPRLCAGDDGPGARVGLGCRTNSCERGVHWRRFVRVDRVLHGRRTRWLSCMERQWLGFAAGAYLGGLECGVVHVGERLHRGRTGGCRLGDVCVALGRLELDNPDDTSQLDPDLFQWCVVLFGARMHGRRIGTGDRFANADHGAVGRYSMDDRTGAAPPACDHRCPGQRVVHVGKRLRRRRIRRHQ